MCTIQAICFAAQQCAFIYKKGLGCSMLISGDICYKMSDIQIHIHCGSIFFSVYDFYFTFLAYGLHNSIQMKCETGTLKEIWLE